MLVETLKRVFKIGDLILKDPDPAMTVDEVRKFYSNQYPEITTATLKDTDVQPEQTTYIFEKSVGTFG